MKENIRIFESDHISERDDEYADDNEGESKLEKSAFGNKNVKDSSEVSDTSSSHSREIKLQDLKNLINQHFIDSNELFLQK